MSDHDLDATTAHHPLCECPTCRPDLVASGSDHDLVEQLRRDLETARYVAKLNLRHHQELYAEYEKLEAEVERLKANQQPDGGEWREERGLVDQDGKFWILAVARYPRRAATHRRRVWLGPVEPITEAAE